MLTQRPEKTPFISTCLLIIFLTLLHLIIANKAGLTVDGAHYALYGIHLDLSYYDHPPMVGYLQAIMLHFGNSEFILRIMPIFLSAGWLFALYFLSSIYFPSASAWQHFLTTCVGASAILPNLLSLEMIPQVPFLFFGLLALIFIYQATIKNRLRDWIVVGLTLGLAGLSEYTALCIAVASFLYVITTKPRLFCEKIPYLSVVIALAVISPVLIWNVQHDFLSIRFQLAHGHHDIHWEFSRFLNSELIQIATYSPAFITLAVISLFSHIKMWKEPPVRLLLLTSFTILLLFAYESGYQRTLPHWVAFGWIITSPLISRWIFLHWQMLSVKILSLFSLSLSAVLILLLHLQIFSPFIPFKDYQNPLIDIYGWKEAAIKANALCDEMRLKTQDNTLGLFVPNWSLASRLAWYSGRPVQVASSRKANDQFTIWYGNPKTGARGILVVERTPPVTGGRGAFQNCQLLDTLSITLHNRKLNDFHFYYCTDFRAASE